MFKRKRYVLKVEGLGPFLGPIYYWKCQNIAKNQNFPWNYILMTIKQHKYQVPDKSEKSYKINQQNPFLGQKWTF